VLQTLSSILGIAFVSGINLYAAILTVGLAQRFGWITGLPASMQILSHPAVLIVAGLFYALEFVADKIPFITPIWDAVHTFIRPLGAAYLALESSANLTPIAKVIAAILAGSIALGTHSTKAGVRLLAHTTPEPASHSAISVAEDFSVVAILMLAFKYPAIAVPLLVLLITGVIILAPLLFRIVRFLIAGLVGRVHSWFGEAHSEYMPEWAGSRLAVRCFTRSGNFLQKVRQGYLCLEEGKFRFVSRRWFRPRTRIMEGAAAIRSGFVYDVISINGESFYVTKEWSRLCAERTSAECASRPSPAPPQGRRIVRV